MQLQIPSFGVAVAATVALFGLSVCSQGGERERRTRSASDAGPAASEKPDAGPRAPQPAASATVAVDPPGLIETLWGVRTGRVPEPADADGGRDADAGTDAADVSDVDWETLEVSEIERRARERELSDRDYPWHDQPRRVDGDVECPDVETVEYEGRVVPYNRPVEVRPQFRERLARFEEIVREVAVEVYGRPPDRIVQHQGYDCKTIREEGEELSEHAFGHAIDVGAFEFDALPGERRDELGRAGRAFTVEVADHWGAEDGFAARHGEFLRRLVRQLQRRGPFSTILGPGYPNHDQYFHFDFGPEFFFRP